jgi:hypothetical protein
MSSTEELTGVDRLLHHTWKLEPESLAVFRVLYGLFVLLVLFPETTWIQSLPASWFEPPFGPLLVLESAPSTAVIRAVMIVAAAALVCVIAGWRTKASSLIAAISLMVLYGIEYSYGKIDHTTFTWLVPAVMAFSTWGNTWSLDERSGRAEKNRGWPVALLLVTLAAAMATAAIAKIRGGWLDLSSSATRAHQLNHVHALGDTALLARTSAENHVGLIDELLDWFAVAFELLFIVAIWRRNWTRWLLVVATAFHLGVVLVLNIAFLGNFCVYGIVVAWPAVSVANAARRDMILHGAIAVGVVAAALAAGGHPALRLVFTWHDQGDLVISTILLAAFAGGAAWWAIRRLSPAPQYVATG